MCCGNGTTLKQIKKMNTENLTQEQLKAVHRKSELLNLFNKQVQLNETQKRHKAGKFANKFYCSIKTTISSEMKIYSRFYNV